MCSVSFVPRDEDGFVLAMNRDERRSRASALPPEVFARHGLTMLFPREPSGGTWIGINSAGMAFSLVNWYSELECERVNAVSRGEIVRALLGTRRRGTVGSLLKGLPLERMNPFRLMVVSCSERSLTEWRYHGGDLQPFRLPWKRQHWFSSAINEPRVHEVRSRVCARVAADSFSVRLLRQLHRSHVPEAGPLSLCMHRSDAATVSYTEISVRGRIASSYYIAGPPCSHSRRFRARLDLDLPVALPKVA
jgi:transport and Golgi organization protein 2